MTQEFLVKRGEGGGGGGAVRSGYFENVTVHKYYIQNFKKKTFMKTCKNKSPMLNWLTVLVLLHLKVQVINERLSAI